MSWRVDAATERRPVTAVPTTSGLLLGHGCVVALAAAQVAPSAELGLFHLPKDGDHLTPTDISAAIALALLWQAQVIVIAKSKRSWGVPPHLRALLREAAPRGRGGPLLHGAL